MKKIILLGCLLLSWGFSFSQVRKVTQAEYFWNTDPGLGNATPLQAADGQFDQAIEELFATSTTVLNHGPNKFGIRVKDAQGVWGNTFFTVLQVDSVSNSVPALLSNRRVTQAEYFWNTDPGNGNGIPLLALDGNLDQSIEELFATSTTVLNYGPNKFGIRVKDNDGVWSHTFLTLVQVDSVDNTVPGLLTNRRVMQAEYFWNTDPGNGNGIPLLALDGNLDQSIEELFAISTTVLNYGPNKFGIRVKDNDGVWSRTFLTLVQVDSVDNSIPSLLANRRVTQAEYFWNTDPGNGNGIPLLALDGNLDQSIEELFATSTTVLNYGPNKFGIRVKDNDGVWSRTFLTLVQVDSVDNTIPSLLTNRRVTQAEYFWNTDPGNGNGIPLLALDGNLDQSIEELFATSTTVLNYGPNKFGIRVKDNDGVWSRTFLTLVQVDSVDNSIPSLLANRKVTRGEYFWDADPGVGQGIPLLFVDGAGDQSVEELQAIDPANLSNGVHRIGLRVFDSNRIAGNTFFTIMVVEGDSTNDFNVYTNTHTVRQCRGAVAQLQAFGARTYRWFPAAGLSTDTGARVNASPDTTTRYLVVGTDSLGRTDSAYVWVKVINEVQVVSVGSTSLCQGQSLVLKARADSSASFQWLKNSVSISGAVDSNLLVVAAGSYQVIASVDGCVDTSIGLTVVVDTPQNLVLQWGSSQICNTGGTWATVVGNTNRRPVQWKRNGVILSNISDSLWIGDGANYRVSVVTPCLDWKDSFQLNVIAVDTGKVQQKICAGQTVTFNGSTLNRSGIYYDTLSSVLGCDSLVELTLMVDTVPFAFGLDSMSACGGSTLLTTSVSGTQYLWSTGGTGNSITVSQSGWYSCTITRDQCSTNDSIYVDLLEVNAGDDTAICAGSSITLGATVNGSAAAASLPANLRQGLVGYWPFNGNANDESGNGNNGTVNGATLAADRFGNPGKAYNFDGFSNILIPYSNQLAAFTGDFTFAFWVKNELPLNHLGAHIMHRSNGCFTVILQGNNKIGIQKQGIQSIYSTSNLFLNNWNHYLVSKTNNTYNTYVNGILDGSVSNATNLLNVVGDPIRIGMASQGGNNGSYYFKGNLDDIAIYNRALSQSEIQQLFNQGQNTFLWSTGATTPTINVSPTQTTTYYCSVNNGITTCTDSVLVRVNQPSTNAISASICSGGSYVFGSRTLSAAGVYRDTLANASGCDSIVVLSLNLNQPTSSALSASICSGSSYFFGGVNRSVSGVYSNVLVGSNGCDSVVTLTLNVNSSIVQSLQASICEGSQYTFGNRNLTLSGIYYDTLRTSTGCDSILALQLTVNSNPTVIIQASGVLAFCQGGSVTLSASGANSYAWSNSATSNSINITQSGNYSVVGTDTNGCVGSASAVQVTVYTPVVPSITANGATNVCNTNVTINSTSAPSYLWSNGATTASIVATASGLYSVTTTDSNGCTAVSNSIQVNKFTAVPSRPVAIAGELNPCAVLGTSNTLTYSVPADPNVLSYTWLLTNGITAVGNATENVISVTYPAGFSTGQIRATPVNACGNGLARAIYPKKSAITTVPTFTQSVTSVCNIRGTATQATYSVQPIPGCSGYQWTMPTQATLISGQGTHSIQVVFDAAFSSGSISVIGISNCGNTPSSSIAISLLAKPVISGSNSICPGDLVTYTMPVVPGAIRYRFNLPAGLSLVSQNANSAVITNNGSFVSGSLGAQVQTTLCGWSQPGSLSLNTSACRGVVGDFSVNIYPNPSAGEFQLQLGAPVKDVQVSVYASDGRLVKRLVFGQVETQTLYFNDVAEGLYHLEVIATDSENKVHRKMEKMLIQR